MPPLDTFPVSLPFTPISPDVDAEAIAISFAPHLTSLRPSNFAKSAVWRDIYALTGTSRTFYGAESILAAWEAAGGDAKPRGFEFVSGSAMVFRAGPACWIQANYGFETNQTSSQAIVSLVQEEGEWKVWLVRTILDSLKGIEGSADFLAPGGGEEIQNDVESKNGKKEFDCAIVGAGQSGLSIAGRLKALGVSYVVLEKNPEVGDNWRKRYDYCKLHLPRETAHLPFERTFGSDKLPEYLSKDQVAKGYKDWVEKYGINVWTDSKLEHGDWNPAENKWTLNVLQGKEKREIVCSHVVMAVGAGGQIPKMPEYANREIFTGDALHSVYYKNASAWNGKHGIVIGAGTTAHDMAEDMLEAGLASVTIVQRNPTYVIPAEYIRDVVSHSYNEHIPTSVADQLTWSIPPPIMALLYKGMATHRSSLEPERFNALEKVGFRLERDGSLAEHIFKRFGGHYVDVGASAKISKGLIKVKSDSLPVRYVEDGLEFEDGERLPADVVVFATGFDKMGDWWGIDNQGEIRSAFRPCEQRGMWYAGGDQSQCRYFSRFVALSIKADVMGVPLHIYND
ncbi:FAD/NAD(P)-binding domain-containing protein [Stipitochalara longipes BDJ]|nr:FAD/NAD(P)-binding domain-containing protein [Stipitochalara longipes BDJ]